MSVRREGWDLAVLGNDRSAHEVAHEAASRGASVILVLPGQGHGQSTGSEQVRVVVGMPRFVTGGVLEVVTSTECYSVEASTFVIGTGSSPRIPSSFLVDNRWVLDSMSFERAAGSRSVAIVGGGRDGLAAASLLATTGVEVTVFDRRHRLLEECDSELVDLLVSDLSRSGIGFRLGEDVFEASASLDGASLVSSSGDVERFDRIVVAVGRRGNTEGLGLECLDLPTDERGRIWCDDRFVTSVPGVRAVGSVIGHPAWLRQSLDQGKRLAVDVLFSGDFSRGPAAAVTSSGTSPDIFQSGQTTEDLLAAGADFESGRVGWEPAARDTLKLLWTRRSGRVLGVHARGPGVAGSVGRVAAAMRRKMTIDKMLSQCGDDALLRAAATSPASSLPGRVASGPEISPSLLSSEHAGRSLEETAFRIDRV